MKHSNSSTFSLRGICAQQESSTVMYPESESEKQGEGPLKDLDFMVPNLSKLLFSKTRHAKVLLFLSSKLAYQSLDLPRPNNMENLSQMKISNTTLPEFHIADHPKVHNPEKTSPQRAGGDFQR